MVNPRSAYLKALVPYLDDLFEKLYLEVAKLMSKMKQ